MNPLAKVLRVKGMDCSNPCTPLHYYVYNIKGYQVCLMPVFYRFWLCARKSWCFYWCTKLHSLNEVLQTRTFSVNVLDTFSVYALDTFSVYALDMFSVYAFYTFSVYAFDTFSVYALDTCWWRVSKAHDRKKKRKTTQAAKHSLHQLWRRRHIGPKCRESPPPKKKV